MESHESARQGVESSLFTKHPYRIAGKGFTSITITFWCTSLFQCHKRWNFRIQKPQWRNNGQSSRRSHHGVWAKRKLFLKQKRQKESPLCCTDRHMSSQECGVGTTVSKSSKAESCFVVTLSKTTLEPLQSLLSKARLRPWWLPQK